jgi:SAM-dependent methyltransferase
MASCPPVASNDPDAQARRLAAQALTAGDPAGWFERLYVAAECGQAVVPWDRGGPHPLLEDWTAGRDLDGRGRSALVVGAGLGADAEHAAGFGFRTVAFDIAPAAIRAARRRFPRSAVEYVTADLLDPPPAWRDAFDLVIESLTVQALPHSLRATATENVARMVAPGGTLLVISTARPEGGPVDGPPWPLTRREVEAFGSGDLRAVRIEEVPYPVESGIRRWRAEFRRP